MGQRTVRVGVIGVGQIGKSHLNGYSKIDQAKVVAVADVNEPEAQRVAAEHGIDAVYTDFRQLLARDDIEAVDVCLHNNLHMPVTVAGLEAGKNVYCEKPMAGTYADARKMLDVATACDRKLSIQCATVFSQEVRAAKRLIDAGKLGQVYHGRSYGYRRRGRPFVDGYGSAQFVSKATAAGGALYDMGVYHITEVLYLMGNPAPLRISGKIYQECEMNEARRQESGYDVEELGCGFVRFGDGVTLDILESWAIHMSPFEGSFVAGSRGGVRLRPFSYHCTMEDMVMDGTFNLDEANTRWHRFSDEQWAYDSSQQHWIAGLLGIVPLEPIAETTLSTALISEGIYLSNALGREVTAEEVAEKSKSTALDV